MSSANACLRVSSTMALPPYFTTMTLPWYFISHGNAAARVAAFAVHRGSGAVARVVRCSS